MNPDFVFISRGGGKLWKSKFNFKFNLTLLLSSRYFSLKIYVYRSKPNNPSVIFNYISYAKTTMYVLLLDTIQFSFEIMLRTSKQVN